MVSARRYYRYSLAGLHLRNPDGQIRQAILSHYEEGDPVFLVRESGKSRDPNAIAVLTEQGEQIGYLTRSDAASLASRMDAGEQFEAFIDEIFGDGHVKSADRCVIAVAKARNPE